MAWREGGGDGGGLSDQLERGFPPPYEGEPADLRRDIADELADHLACAVARERERTGDETTARRAALERFGDPRALARKLWFEAMKERIMKDRIMFVSVLLLALAAVAGAVFSWQAFQQSQRANQAMLAALDKIAGGQNAISKDKGELQVTVTKGDKEKTPVKGLNVRLNGQIFGEHPEDLRLATDEQGIIKCGPMNPCSITLSIDSPPMDGVQLKHIESALVFAGQQAKVAIAYPELVTAPVSVVLDQAAELKGVKQIIGANLVATTQIGSSHWNSDLRIGINTDNGKVTIIDAHYPENDWPTIVSSDTSGKELVQPANWPAIEYKLTSLVLYDPDPQYDRKFAKSYIINYPVEQQPTFKIEPGKPNQLKIKLPENMLKRLHLIALLQNGPDAIKNLDPGLGALVVGRIRQVLPVDKGYTIWASQPDRNGTPDMTLSNYQGGYRVLLNWPVLSPEMFGKANQKYLLALNVSDIRDSFGMASADQPTTTGAIGAYPILSDWQPENVTWQKQPSVAPEPAMRYDFKTDKGWKFFDITPIVKQQVQSGTAHGIMLRFVQEGMPEVKASYYYFCRVRDQKGNQPVLLVVDE